MSTTHLELVHYLSSEFDPRHRAAERQEVVVGLSQLACAESIDERTGEKRVVPSHALVTNTASKSAGAALSADSQLALNDCRQAIIVLIHANIGGRVELVCLQVCSSVLSSEYVGKAAAIDE